MAARQGARKRRQARRPRGHRGHRPVLHPRQRQGRRARRGRLQHRLRRAQRRLHRVREGHRAAHRGVAAPRVRLARTRFPRRPRRPSCASSSSRPPTSPRTCARRSPRASCASGWRRSCCSTRSTSTPTSTTARRSSSCAPSSRAKTGENVVIRRFARFAVGRVGSPAQWVTTPASVQTNPAEAVGRVPDGLARLRHRSRAAPGGRRADQAVHDRGVEIGDRRSAPGTSTAASPARRPAWTARPRTTWGCSRSSSTRCSCRTRWRSTASTRACRARCTSRRSPSPTSAAARCATSRRAAS